MRYPDVVMASIRWYTAHLERVGQQRPDLADLCGQLIHFMEQADDGRLCADRPPFTVESLAGLDAESLELLINQAAPGFGRDDSKVLFCGTEAACPIEATPCFALESCSLPALWRTGSPPELVAAIAGRRDWEEPARLVPFHIFPAPYGPFPPGHTYNVILSVLKRLPRHLLRPDPHTQSLTCCGDAAYLSELSAHGAKSAHEGAAPTSERIGFLEQAMRRFRDTARVVVFHGRGSPVHRRAFAAAQHRLALAFLGCTALPTVHEERVSSETGRRSFTIRWCEHDGRRVIWSRALNGRVGNPYRDKLAELILPVL